MVNLQMMICRSVSYTHLAILVIQDGVTKLVNIKHQDAMTKIIDMVPDIVNRFTGGKKDISEEAIAKAEEMAEEYAAADAVVETEKK